MFIYDIKVMSTFWSSRKGPYWPKRLFEMLDQAVFCVFILFIREFLQRYEITDRIIFIQRLF
jgi:hypothetical protein